MTGIDSLVLVVVLVVVAEIDYAVKTDQGAFEGVPINILLSLVVVDSGREIEWVHHRANEVDQSTCRCCDDCYRADSSLGFDQEIREHDRYDNARHNQKSQSKEKCHSTWSAWTSTVASNRLVSSESGEKRLFQPASNFRFLELVSRRLWPQVGLPQLNRWRQLRNPIISQLLCYRWILTGRGLSAPRSQALERASIVV